MRRMKDGVEMVFEQDPVVRTTFEVITTHVGLHAVWSRLVTHKLYNKKHYILVRMISQVSRFFIGIGIHPGTRIGKRLFIDRDMGVVIGETYTIGGNVAIYQDVTLGGAGKQKGRYHPDIGDNVLIAAGLKVLGDIQIDFNINISANSVVLQSVPSYTAVVGIPGHIVKQEGKRIRKALNHRNLPDPLFEQIK